MFSERQHRYLKALGVEAWARREDRRAAPDRVRAVESTLVVVPPPAPVVVSAPPPGGWDALAQEVAACQSCGLHAGRTQTVFGVGHRQAKWLFVGEAPGAEEDRRGEPFVGSAGQLLNAMLYAMGLKREEIYIANVLKCRPPENRDPQGEEVGRCEPFLVRQIELIGPRIVVALGRFAAHSLLKTDLPLSRLRGQQLSYQGIPVVVTYHPAYLLRNPADKRRAWDDLKLAMAVMAS